jgi:hypothetical protein
MLIIQLLSYAQPVSPHGLMTRVQPSESAILEMTNLELHTELQLTLPVSKKKLVLERHT